jgi:hypothetical protein
VVVPYRVVWPAWLVHTVQGGTFRELLVATGRIQDPHGYLPAVLDQGPWYVESFWRSGLRTRFYQIFFRCVGFCNRAVNTPSHCSGISWPLAITSREGRGPTRGFITMSLPPQDAAFGTLDQHAVCPSPRWTRLWLASNTQIFCELRPRVLVRKTYFKMGRDFPDTFFSV